MPITVQCTCGKRFGVGDFLAGKTVKCTACGEPVFVAAAGGAAGKSRGKSPGKVLSKEQAQIQTPAIYLSKGKIVFLSILAGIGLLVFIFKIGPLRVNSQWQAMQPKVDGDVRSVISFGLQAYESQSGLYDPNFQHMVPVASDHCVFIFEPLFCFTMPEKIVFRGKSNQGDYMGTYDTQTGEVEADVYYGGYSVAGLIDIAKPTGMFHMTGRISNGFPQAESNGQKLQIIYPPQVPQR
ncbi:MAG: hypothetical protein ABSF29_08430 [Tepidisphaeraceae bacterium]|jgi:hypothetical protein